MFNIYTYNEKPFNAVYTRTETFIEDTIIYNDFWLQNDSIIITNIDSDETHNIQSDIFYRPLSDWAWQLNYYLREKVITARGYWKAPNAEQLNIEIDRLKKILLQPQKYLTIKVNGEPRRAKASLINGGDVFNRQNFHITFIPFQLQFRILDKMKSTKSENVSVLWQTGDFIEEVFNQWTAKAEGVITFVFNSASWTDTVSFTTNGETITINRTFSASDILIIDTENKVVTVNSVERDYTWVFPEFDTGLQTYSVEVNGTVNYDLTIKYFNTYL